MRKEQNEEMDEDQELSAVFNKTLEYTEKFSFYQNRETIKVILLVKRITLNTLNDKSLKASWIWFITLTNLSNLYHKQTHKFVVLNNFQSGFISHNIT